MVRNFLIMLKNLQQMHLNFRQKERFKKQEEATGDLIENKTSDKITTASKTSPKSNSETNEEKKLRKKYISPELRQKIIDDLRLKEENFC